MHIPSSRFFPLTFLCLLFYESHLSSLISFVPLVSPYYLPLHLRSPALRMYRGSSRLTHYSEYHIFWDLPSGLLWPIIGHLHFQEFWDSRWFSQRCLVYQKLEARKNEESHQFFYEHLPLTSPSIATLSTERNAESFPIGKTILPVLRKHYSSRAKINKEKDRLCTAHGDISRV